MLNSAGCFEVVYETKDKIWKSFLAHLMLLQESIELLSQIGNERSNVDSHVFVDSSVEIDNVDINLRVEW